MLVEAICAIDPQAERKRRKVRRDDVGWLIKGTRTTSPSVQDTFIIRRFTSHSLNYLTTGKSRTLATLQRWTRGAPNPPSSRNPHEEQWLPNA